MRIPCAVALILFLSFNSFAGDTVFTTTCKKLDVTNVVIDTVRVKTLAVYSMRLSALSDAKKVSVSFTDMKGNDKNLTYSMSAPSPTDNIMINYISQSMINNILLDACYNSKSELVAISSHE